MALATIATTDVQRPSLRLPWTQLAIISVYRFGMSAIWGGYEQFGQKQVELIVGADRVGISLGLLELVGALIASDDLHATQDVADGVAALWGNANVGVDEPEDVPGGSSGAGVQLRAVAARRPGHDGAGAESVGCGVIGRSCVADDDLVHARTPGTPDRPVDRRALLQRRDNHRYAALRHGPRLPRMVAAALWPCPRQSDRNATAPAPSSGHGPCHS